MHSIYCTFCDLLLPPSHTGPCPNCGNKSKVHHITITTTLTIRDRLSITKVRSYFETNKKARNTSLLIGYGSPFLGFFISAIPGFVIGLLITALARYFIPPENIKIIEKERINDPEE